MSDNSRTANNSFERSADTLGLNKVREIQPSTPLPDRIFFSLTGLWFVALTFVGFSRSFYLRILPEPLPAHQIVHGVVYSAWVVLFLVQALLIFTDRRRWHIALGAASVFLLLAMIPVGFHVVLVKTAPGLKSADEAGFNLTGMTLALHSRLPASQTASGHSSTSG